MNQITDTGQENKLTDQMLRSVVGTGPWVRFFSVLGFISVGFMVLGGLAMLVMSLIGGAMAPSTGMAFMLPLAALYFVIGVVYFFPSLFLWQSASAVVRMKQGAVCEGLETALEKLRKFWKFIGIFTIVFLVLYPIFIVVLLIAGLM